MLKLQERPALLVWVALWWRYPRGMQRLLKVRTSSSCLVDLIYKNRCSAYAHKRQEGCTPCRRSTALRTANTGHGVLPALGWC
jgi:hypothetical protein